MKMPILVKRSSEPYQEAVTRTIMNSPRLDQGGRVQTSNGNLNRGLTTACADAMAPRLSGTLAAYAHTFGGSIALRDLIGTPAAAVLHPEAGPRGQTANTSSRDLSIAVRKYGFLIASASMRSTGRPSASKRVTQRLGKVEILLQLSPSVQQPEFNNEVSVTGHWVEVLAACCGAEDFQPYHSVAST